MPATLSGRRPTAPRPSPRRLGRAFAAVLALLLLITACGGGEEEPPEEDATGTTAGEEDAGAADGGTEGEPPEDPVTIRIGQLSIGFLPYPLMEEIPETVAPNLGTWYEVEFSRLDAPDIGRSIASGIVDGAGINTISAGQVINQGVDLVIAGSLNDDHPDHPASTWLVRADSGITSAADIAGQTVGSLGAGVFADVVADTYFREEAGLEPGVDYQKAEVPFAQMPDALATGQIATGPFIPPFTQQARADQDVEVLFTGGDVLPGLVIVVQAFRRDFYEENPEAVGKFLEDWVNADRWMRDPANRDQVIEVYAEFSGVPFEAYDSWIFTDDDLYRPEDGYLDLDALQRSWDYFYEEGVLDAELDVQDHVVEELLVPEP